MKVIVLSKSNYKEKNCIYNAISENESFSFQARGAQDNNSPFVWLNNPLTVADIELAEDGRYKYKLLKNAAPIISLVGGGENDLTRLLVISTLAELTSRALGEEEKHTLFNPLLSAIEALKRGKDPLMVTLIYIAKLLKVAGTDLEVDKCVFCGTTHDIVAFSFSDGGFVCRNCMSAEVPKDLNPTQMKMMRYIFKSPDYSCENSDSFTKEDKLFILAKFKEFIDEYLGVNITSINYLLNN